MNKINISTLGRQHLRKRYDNGIELYNPDEQERKQILEIIMNSIDTNTNKVIISGEDLIIKLLPIYSNIYLDTDNMELVRQIIKDPSDVLEEVMIEIEQQIKKIIDRLIRNWKEISEMSPEEMKSLFGTEDEEPLTDEEVAEYNRLQEKMEKLKKR